MKGSSSLIATLGLMVAGIAAAQHGGMSPHSGAQNREIASLPDRTIAAIRAGPGWGLALPAEVNDAPGPRHVLDLAEPLALSDDQVAQITAIFEEMKRSALSKGEDFIAAERALEDAFVRGDLDQAGLAELVEKAGKARSDLRLVHLSAHLKTVPVLSDEQIERYAELRGYSGGAGGPCDAVPEGHDPEMWKKHHGC